ncbi:hypothetical protein IIA15_11605, partial [candidate division TA06 bacterium]|nr:hypothetical protein [candidate division TA06 bacterium]
VSLSIVEEGDGEEVGAGALETTITPGSDSIKTAFTVCGTSSSGVPSLTGFSPHPEKPTRTTKKNMKPSKKLFTRRMSSLLF